jgi:hypothetical protein
LTSRSDTLMVILMATEFSVIWEFLSVLGLHQPQYWMELSLFAPLSMNFCDCNIKIKGNCLSL